MEGLITVVIPTYARDHVLVQTVREVLKNIGRETEEVIIVDQTPKHGMEVESILGKWDRQGVVRWIRLEKPSLTAARNVGLREARTPLVAFLDDDVLLPGNIFRRFLPHFEKDSEIAAVGGQNMVLKSGAKAGPGIWAKTKPVLPEIEHEMGWAPGASGCYDRQKAISVGGFDETIFGPAMCEDKDMGHRLTLAGHAVWYDPNIRILHLRAPTGGCRIPGAQWPEWTKTGFHFLYLFRHAAYTGEFRSILAWSLRCGPLRRENATSLRRQPSAWLGVLLGIAYGWRNRRRMKSIFTDNSAVLWDRCRRENRRRVKAIKR